MKAKLELEFQSLSELKEYLGQTLGECKCHQAAQVTVESEAMPAAEMLATMPEPAPVAPAPMPEPVAPAPMPAPVPAAPQPVPAPVATTAVSYTLDDLAHAGAELADMGKQPELPGLLKRFGISSLSELTPDKYNDFAVALREMGARI